MLGFALKHSSVFRPESPLRKITTFLLHVHATPLSQSAPRDLYMVFPPLPLLKHSAGRISWGGIGVGWPRDHGRWRLWTSSRDLPLQPCWVPMKSRHLYMKQEAQAAQCTHPSPLCTFLGPGELLQRSPCSCLWWGGIPILCAGSQVHPGQH